MWSLDSERSECELGLHPFHDVCAWAGCFLTSDMCLMNQFYGLL